jgi:hypothetical protein
MTLSSAGGSFSLSSAFGTTPTALLKKLDSVIVT